MARIAFVMLPQDGHINGSMGLAKTLRQRGHQVHFVGIADWRERIASAGFEFETVLPDVYPPRLLREAERRAFRARGLNKLLEFRAMLDRSSRALIGLRRELPRLVVERGFDLMLVEVLLPHVALAAFGGRAKVMTLGTLLPSRYDAVAPPLSSVETAEPGSLRFVRHQAAWGRARAANFSRRVVASALGYADCGLPALSRLRRAAGEVGYPPGEIEQGAFVPALRAVPELVLCPRAFDFERASSAGLHYSDPAIDFERPNPGEALPVLDARPLVYCSVGSQRDASTPGVARLIGAAIGALAQRPHLQLLVTIGDRDSAAALRDVPSNVHVMGVAPQLDVLPRSTAMITHAGLNTVKECIWFGVPMLAYPFGYDQFGNAARIAHHGLGLSGNRETVSAAALGAQLDQLLSEPRFRRNTSAMQTLFRSAQAQQTAAQIVEAYLDSGTIAEEMSAAAEAALVHGPAAPRFSPS